MCPSVSFQISGPGSFEVDLRIGRVLKLPGHEPAWLAGDLFGFVHRSFHPFDARG